jgi:hypothetical protein
MLCTQCAVYDVDTSMAGTPETASAGAGSAVVAGSGSFAGTSFAADSNRFYAGGGSRPNSGVGDAAVGGALSAGGGGSGAGADAVGGANGGVGAPVGAGGGAGAPLGAGGGVVGSVDEPSGSGAVADYNLSQGKTATTDSEQSHRSHFAVDANDGDRSTRWCAANWKENHYWEVDLGETFSLSALRVVWEKDNPYLFRVDSSADRVTWSVALDRTKVSSATADQHYSLPPGTTGRYVRITVTGGLAFNVWASFYELEVFGH